MLQVDLLSFSGALHGSVTGTLYRVATLGHLVAQYKSLETTKRSESVGGNWQ